MNRKYIIVLFTLVALLGFTNYEAKAAEQTIDLPAIELAAGISESIPDISAIGFIQNLHASGAKIYFLGKKLGLNGWFAIKGEQIQLLYTTLDNKGLFVGSLLAADGTNISQQQMAMLANGNPQIKTLFKTSGQPATMPTMIKKGDLPGVGLTRSNPSLPEINKDGSREQQIYDDLQRAAQIVFGKDGLPQLTILLDINNALSKTIWKKLISYVDDGRLQVVMIPFTVSGSQSDTDAANLFQKKDPYEAWKRHLDNEIEIIRTGKVNVDLEDIINATTQTIVGRWKMEKPVYLFYHTKDGALQVKLDLPQSTDVLMVELLTPAQTSKPPPR
jgi:hypothetical protein